MRYRDGSRKRSSERNKAQGHGRTNEREGYFGSAATSRRPCQDFHRLPFPPRPTLLALRQSISNSTRILLSSSPCSLYLFAAKDDKTGLSNLRGAKCAIL